MSDEENIPLAAAVLDYATYEADGLPPWVAEAETLIDRRAKPGKIREYFRKTGDALKYFAKSMRRRFPISAVGTTCQGCGQSPCPTAVGLQWLVRMPLKTMEFKLQNSQPETRFQTYHCFCSDCCYRWSKSLHRIRVGTIIWQVLKWAWIVILVAGNYARRNRIISTGTPWILYVWPAYFAVLMLLGWTLKLWSRWRLPQGIKKLLPPNVTFLSIEVFDNIEKLIVSPPAQTGTA